MQQGKNFSNVTKAHWAAEEIFNWADIGAIHINPYYFMENYLVLPGPALQKESTAYVPYDPNVKHVSSGSGRTRMILLTSITIAPYRWRRPWHSNC